jgi:hypothetical protein
MRKMMRNNRQNHQEDPSQTQEGEDHQDLEVGEDQLVVVNEIVFV